MAPKASAAPQKKAIASTAQSAGATPQLSSMTPALQKPEEGAAPMTPKNFRNHPDMENFFRFIYDNDLRIEALQIIDEIIAERKARKKKGPASA